jgi:SET domain-containing protein
MGTMCGPGNVGRFINHSCSPNLETAVVLTQGCTAVQYRLAFFVGTEAGIAPGEELTYNYGWSPNSNTVLKGLQCQCGAPNCVGALL